MTTKTRDITFMPSGLLAVAVCGLLGALTASPARAAVKDIPGLQSITFWERTGGTGPTAFTFSATTPASPLMFRLPTLNSSSKDFEGVLNYEFYDVFYSDANGSFNLNGQFVTIEARFDVVAFGGAWNIAEVQLNFTSGPSKFANSVASFAGYGNNYELGTEQLAVDGNLLTATIMGNTIGTTQRLRVTVGFPGTVKVPFVPSVSDWGMGVIVLLLLTGVTMKFGRRRAVTA